MERGDSDGGKRRQDGEGIEPRSDGGDSGRDGSLNVVNDLEGISSQLEVVVDERRDWQEEGLVSAWSFHTNEFTKRLTGCERPADSPEGNVPELGHHLGVIRCKRQMRKSVSRRSQNRI